MPTEALPCIACGHILENVSGDCENQPYEGTAFLSHGHYGSTVFDPMDGHFIEINICDSCLVEAGKRGAVLTSRDSIPVFAPDVRFGKSQVGHLPVDRPYVPWKKDLPGYDDDDAYLLTFDDDETLPKDIKLRIPYEQLKVTYFTEIIEEAIKANPDYVLCDEEIDIVRRFLQIPGRWNPRKFAAQYPQFEWLIA